MIWIKIKYRISLFFVSFLMKIGCKKRLLQNKYGERIIVFHGIDNVGETKYNSRFHSEAFLEKFIAYIAKNYNVISLEDFYQNKFKENTLNIALTFDDGYLNNFNYAAPILEKHNVPASFFVTTTSDDTLYLWPDFLDLTSNFSKKKSVVFENEIYYKNNKNEFVCRGISLKNKCKQLPFSKIEQLFSLFKEEWKEIQQKPLDEYWKLMSENQIKEISDNPLFTIGSHSCTHVNLAAITIEEAKNEILKSKENLQQKLQIPITDFAFPFGIYNLELAEYCKEIGFTKILLLDYNSNQDKKREILKNRFVMNPYVDLNLQIRYLLKGKYC